VSGPLITVVVAVFNGSSTLQQCIDSVARQTYAKRELIVIDGASTDGTVELLRNNQNAISYWVSEPDRGIFSAWNKALKRAHGEWICFLGADDYLWDEKVLEQMSARLRDMPGDVDVAYGKIMIVNSKGDDIHLFGTSWDKVRSRFKQLMSIPHQATMHRRSLFQRHGDFDESFRIAGDYEFLLRELKSAEARFIPDVIVAAMRQGGGISSTPANAWVVLRETRKAQLKHGFRVPGAYYLLAASRLWLRSLLWNILGERSTRKMLDVGRRAMGLPPFWTKS
jgi:glycosyltransferase involved in cell wall biosynthesis